MFSIFNWKKNARELMTSDKIQALFSRAKELIVEYSTKIEMTGAEKKVQVDKKLIEWIKENFKTSNSIVKWLINNLLIPVLPIITQNIYDLIKLFVKNITKVAE